MIRHERVGIHTLFSELDLQKELRYLDECVESFIKIL